MSVRKRTWKTAAGEERQAWLCDYTGQSGKRHVKTFARKKDADAFIAKAKVEVREGVHTADSDSVMIRDAADLWLTTGAARGAQALGHKLIGAPKLPILPLCVSGRS